MNDLKFSVSMCVYGKDNPDWFRTAVDSILNQTRRPDEVVLVVDGPVPDELDAIIRLYEALPFFRVIRLAVNEGHGNARRKGLSACTNELVALMDADDIAAPDRFEKQLRRFIEDPSLSIVGGNITEFIDTPDNVVGERTVPEKEEDICAYLKKRCPFNQMTVMFRKSDVEEVGGYIDFYCEEDYYLWLRLYLAGKHLANLPDVLVNVRVGKDMYRRRGGWRYFKSERRLQKFMRKNKVIGMGTYLSNVTKRFIVQVLLPNRLRGWVFQKFARSKPTPTKKYKIGYTTGVYDMFHIGHLNILKRAKEQCEYLIVGVTTDALCYQRKQKYPIICESERIAIVEAVRYVDKVIPQSDMDKLAAVKRYGADAVFVGSDWKGTDAWNQYEKDFANAGCTVVYLDHTDGISSTILRERLNKQ